MAQVLEEPEQVADGHPWDHWGEAGRPRGGPVYLVTPQQRVAEKYGFDEMLVWDNDAEQYVLYRWNWETQMFEYCD